MTSPSEIKIKAVMEYESYWDSRRPHPNVEEAKMEAAKEAVMNACSLVLTLKRGL